MSLLDYWIGKYGLVEAVKVYAPDDVKDDPIVIAAMVNIEMAEYALKARIEKMMEGRDE